MVTTEKSLANFTPIFVLAGMMIFLIPIITEKALGRIDATADTGPNFAYFNYIRYHLDAGKFTHGPDVGIGAKFVTWATAGTGFFTGDEKGYVKVDVIDT